MSISYNKADPREEQDGKKESRSIEVFEDIPITTNDPTLVVKIGTRLDMRIIRNYLDSYELTMISFLGHTLICIGYLWIPSCML